MNTARPELQDAGFAAAPGLRVKRRLLLNVRKDLVGPRAGIRRPIRERSDAVERQHLVAVVVTCDARASCLKVVDRLRARGGRSGTFCTAGTSKAIQDGDDGDHDKEFNQRESRAGPKHDSFGGMVGSK